MISFEDIIEDAKRYVQGKMDAEQRAAFEDMLRENPGLKSEVELMKNMVNVMLELPAEEINHRMNDLGDGPKMSGGFLRRKYWILAVGLTLIVIAMMILNKDRHFVKSVNVLDQPGPEHGLSTFSGQERSGLRANTSSDLALGPHGNLFISGNFYRQIEIGEFVLRGDTSSLDFFVAQLTPDLHVEWAKAFGGSGHDYARSIAVDSFGSVIFSGNLGDTTFFNDVMVVPKSDRVRGHARDLFIAKMNADQSIAWVQHEGGRIRPYVSSGGGGISDLSVDSDGHIYGVGRFSNPTIWGYSLETTKGANSFVFKFDSSGVIQWLKPLIGEYGVLAHTLAISDTAIIVAGSFGHPAYGGDIIWNETPLPSFGGEDMFLAQFDQEGKMRWISQAGSELTSKSGVGEAITAVAADRSRNLIVAGGYFAGKTLLDSFQVNARKDRDIFISKVDQGGNFLWVESAGGGVGPNDGTINSAFDAVTSVAVDPAGNIYACGFFSDSSYFDGQIKQSKGMHDLFVAKFDHSGSLLWFKQMGGDNPEYNSDFAQKMVVTKEGVCYVTGYFSGTLAIDNFFLESAGTLDIFILALESDGNIRNFDQVLFAQL